MTAGERVTAMHDHKSLWQRLPGLFHGTQTRPGHRDTAPPHALVADESGEIDLEITRRIDRLVPHLLPEGRVQLCALTEKAIERLAHNRLPRLCELLAEEIRALDGVPMRAVIAQELVPFAGPVLEHALLLSDSDFIDILSTALARFAILRIAHHIPHPADGTGAVALALAVPESAALLSSTVAPLREQALDKIAQHAESIADWDAKLFLRDDISQRTSRRISGFVAATLIDNLAEQHRIDAKARHHLGEQMRLRIAAGDENLPEMSRAADFETLFRTGALNEAFVETAIQAGAKDTVVRALAFLANIKPETVERIFRARAARPIAALVWRAGLGMRVAFKIQTLLLHLPADELLPAHDGVSFPMSVDEMRMHLDYFGIRRR
jgi:hypothetical protein